MNQFKNAQVDLVQRIVNGECARRQVPSEISRIEKSFPGEHFGSYLPQRKEKPWDMSYLKELEELFYHGADSKEFIEYIAEVSDEIYRAKRVRKILLCSLLVVACVAVVVVLIKSLWGN